MSELNADKIYGEIVRVGDEWADLDHAATLLEESKKSVYAELINQADGSVSAREYIAAADPVYKLHVVNMVNARREANKGKIRFDAVKLLAELRRSEESTRRALMRNS